RSRSRRAACRATERKHRWAMRLSTAQHTLPQRRQTRGRWRLRAAGQGYRNSLTANGVCDIIEGRFRAIRINTHTMHSRRPILVLLNGGLAGRGAPSRASARYLTFYGGPTSDSTTQPGYQPPATPYPGSQVGNGVAAAPATKYPAGTNLGSRA